MVLIMMAGVNPLSTNLTSITSSSLPLSSDHHEGIKIRALLVFTYQISGQVVKSFFVPNEHSPILMLSVYL